MTIERATAEARRAGVSENAIVCGAASLVPFVAMGRLAAVTPELALALEYDVEAALE